MALCKQAVDKAWWLFRDILFAENMRINSFVEQFDKNDPDDADTIGFVFGNDEKKDHGWENVFIQLRDFTPRQREIWENRKKAVPNSSFVHEPNEHGVWQIGFF
jgi:hypothetical protein